MMATASEEADLSLSLRVEGHRMREAMNDVRVQRERDIRLSLPYMESSTVKAKSQPQDSTIYIHMHIRNEDEEEAMRAAVSVPFITFQ